MSEEETCWGTGLIEIEVFYRAGQVAGFLVRGHAGCAPKGQDVVCAAVSALTQAAVAGLEDYLGLRPRVQVREGWLECHLAPGEEEEPRAQAILHTLLLGLRGIAAAEPRSLVIREQSE